MRVTTVEKDEFIRKSLQWRFDTDDLVLHVEEDVNQVDQQYYFQVKQAVGRAERAKKRSERISQEMSNINPQEVQSQLQTLHNALTKAKEQLVAQDKFIRKLTSPPLSHATVVAVSEGKPFSQKDFVKGLRVSVVAGEYKGQSGYVVRPMDDDGDIKIRFDNTDDEHWIKVKKQPYPVVPDSGVQESTATIVMENKFYEVLLPDNLAIVPGDSVRIISETLQIVDVSPTQMGGDIAYVRRIVDETFVEVDFQGSIRVVFRGNFKNTLEVGDRVVLDLAAIVIKRNLGKDDERFSFNIETNVTWKDIGGLEEAKHHMIEAVELPHTHAKVFKFYGKKPIKGILLYGPPGCGKTMLGKATATALAKIYNGGSVSTGFIYVKGPEILDRYVGVAEATIRQIFQRARKHKETHGYPAVVFIDEADSILGKRGSGISSDVERTIVPMFLTEMDGLEDSGALMILATNRADMLDPAVVRDGRIDRKIKITRPTQQSATDIFKLNLKKIPLHNGYTVEQLSVMVGEHLFSDRYVLYNIAMKDGSERHLTLGNICNGGMIVSVVNQATSIALHRDLKTKKTGGLDKTDLEEAVASVFKQNFDLNHTDEISDFIHDYRDDVVSIQKLSQGR